MALDLCVVASRSLFTLLQSMYRISAVRARRVPSVWYKKQSMRMLDFESMTLSIFMFRLIPIIMSGC